MIIYPAIDILDGKVVRLLRGDYERKKSYEISCADAAISFKQKGATHIHAVDLDGAKSGNADNAATVKSIIRATDAFVEIGGGVRSEAQIADYLEAGAGRVILGTSAVRNFGFVREMAAKYAGKIAVGVDALGGKVAVAGWREVTDINSADFCGKLADAGVGSVIYTDISRDGTLCGIDAEMYGRLAEIDGLEITASGGIASIDDIVKLKDAGVHAAILGKALYEGAIDLREAIKTAEKM